MSITFLVLDVCVIIADEFFCVSKSFILFENAKFKTLAPKIADFLYYFEIYLKIRDKLT